MTKQNFSSFEMVEAFLFSKKFIFMVVLAGTVPMILHSHQLFFSISPFKGNVYLKNAYALFYAISFDLTILVFTIHFLKHKPVLYAVFSFIINLLYYNPFGFIPEAYIMGFTKVFIAGVLAYTGYSYAELFVEKVVEKKGEEQEAVEKVLTPVYNLVNSDVDIPVDSENEQENTFCCEYCKQEFASVKALNGHMKKHRNMVSLPTGTN